MKTGTRWNIEDLTANTQSKTDDLIEAMATVDFLHRRLKHTVKMTQTETGQEFNWFSK